MGLFTSYKSGSKKISSYELKKWLQQQQSLTQQERKDLYSVLQPRLKRGLTDREIHAAVRELRSNTQDSIEHTEALRTRKSLRKFIFGK